MFYYQLPLKIDHTSSNGYYHSIIKSLSNPNAL